MHKSCSCSCGTAAAAADGPMAVLKAEHRVIERVLDAVERVSQEPRVDREFFLQAVDFIRNFADGCHHHKEEEQLFPVMEQAGVPREDGPIGCMLHEHEMGRSFVRAILGHLDAAAAGDASAAAAVREAAAQYVRLLRFHIQKEDNVLFAMADAVLSSQAKSALMSAFEHDDQCSADGKHQRYINLAERLYKRAFEPAACAAV